MKKYFIGFLLSLFFTVNTFAYEDDRYTSPVFFPMGNYSNSSYDTSDKPFYKMNIGLNDDNSFGENGIEQIFNIIDNDGKYGGEGYDYETKDTRFLLFKAIYEYLYDKNRSIKNNYISEKKEKLSKEIDLAKLRYDDKTKAENDYNKYVLKLNIYFESYFSYLNYSNQDQSNIFFSFDEKEINIKEEKINIYLNNINLISKDLINSYNDKFKKIYLFGVNVNRYYYGPFMKSGNDMIYLESEKDLDKIKTYSGYLLTEGIKTKDGFILKNINKNINKYSLYVLGITNDDKILIIENINSNILKNTNYFNNITSYNNISSSHKKIIDKYISNISNDKNSSSKAKKGNQLKDINFKIDLAIIKSQNSILNEKNNDTKLINLITKYNLLTYFKSEIENLFLSTNVIGF